MHDTKKKNVFLNILYNHLAITLEQASLVIRNLLNMLVKMKSVLLGDMIQ